MESWAALIVGATLFVAYANGANDNFKGVATLFGSGTTSYRKALWWATILTLARSLAPFYLAGQLILVFQGKGLIPSELSESEPFVAAGGIVFGRGLSCAPPLVKFALFFALGMDHVHPSVRTLCPTW